MNIACEFGDNERLKGVLTRLEKNRRIEMMLVLVSAGFTAKSGPHRMYSELASSLSTAGIATMRFDLGGIGNSQVLNSGMPLETRTKHDIKDALDYLQERYGTNQFVIGGLCSGAEDGFRYAEGDDRVKGLLLIDPHAYRTGMWSIKRVLSQHFVNRVIYKLMSVLGIINVARDEYQASNVEGLGDNLVDYQHTSHDESARILKILVDRGVRLHYVYTAGRMKVFNHRRQFFGMFKGIDFGSCLTLDFIPHIDHTQIFEEDRNELVSAIVQQLCASHA
jgi:pimeloyl-ACP methyl ester carboxylesterase